MSAARKWHGQFLMQLGPRLLTPKIGGRRYYTDGGPTDDNRVLRRAAGKRQRQARKKNR